MSDTPQQSQEDLARELAATKALLETTQRRNKELEGMLAEAEADLAEAQGDLAAMVSGGGGVVAQDEVTANIAHEQALAEKDAEIESLKTQLETLQAKAKQQGDTLRAEMESFRTRAEREIEKAKTAGVEKFAKSLVNFADTFNFAMKATQGLTADSEAEAAAIKSIIEGLQTIETAFLAELEKVGIERMDVKPGDKPDPNFHNIVAQAPGGDVQTGSILDVAQVGYVIKEGDKKRTLREARVVVAL